MNFLYFDFSDDLEKIMPSKIKLCCLDYFPTVFSDGL